tara:strand:- start:934 stop:1374 length:441 start_codon:yes stop_codon:yes gene_type:complete
MQYRISKQALVPYSANLMYDLVNDIERYGEFVPWCSRGYVESREGNVVCGVLVFTRMGMQYTLKTKNVCQRPDTIVLELIEGPLDHLQGQWSFHSYDKGCEVRLTLDVRLHSYGLHMLFNTMFDSLSERLVEVFVHRAHVLYGEAH